MEILRKSKIKVFAGLITFKSERIKKCLQIRKIRRNERSRLSPNNPAISHRGAALCLPFD
jgi:hypothetical protein